MTQREVRWCLDISNERGWPPDVTLRLFDIFGPRIFNAQSRFVRGLHRRILHALETWEERCGAFNNAQEAYSHTILVYCIKRGADEGKTEVEKYRFILYLMAQMVNHEKVREGFKRRAEELTSEYDNLIKRVPA